MDFRGISVAFLKGIYDSIRGMSAVFYLDKEIKNRKRKLFTHNEENTLISRILQCGLLNGAIFLSSIIFFEMVFIPIIQLVIFSLDSKIWYWTEIILRYTFQTIWVVPLFAVAKCINVFWFQDIGQSAFRYSGGRPSSTQSISKTIADFIFSTLIESLFLCQAVFISYIPPLGYISYLIHLCLLYSLYSFEYKWSEMGWELHKRLACIETNWPYFIGFGLPLVLFTQIINSIIISGCIFSIFFPFFIISANEATPIYKQCIPLRLFSPVIFLSDTFFNNLIGKR